jgi:O-antigen ligase/Flp pilus assembly protein TadD
MASWLLVATIGVGIGLLATPFGRIPVMVLIAMASGVCILACAALFSADPLSALVGRYPRFEGVTTIVGYALAATVGARLLSSDAPPGHRRLFTSALAVAAMANAAVSVFQLIQDPAARVIGLLGNSSILGSWAIVAVAVLAWQWLEERRMLWLMGALAAIAVLLLAASRAAWLGAAVMLVALPALYSGMRGRQRWWIGPLGALALAALALALPSGQARLSGSTPFSSATITGRLQLWQDSWSMIAAHPALGVGPSGFVDAINAHHGPAWASAVGPYAPPDSPHNLVFQVLSSTGFIGLIAVAGIVATMSWTLWRARPWDGWQASVICAAGGVGVAYLFGFTDPVTTTLVFVLLGSAIASPVKTPPRWARPTVFTGAALWLAASAFLAGSTLVAEARLSAAVSARVVSPLSIIAAAQTRPWDPDLAIRAGRVLAALAASGKGSAQPGIPMVQAACARLPTSTECRLVLGDLQTLAGHPTDAVSTLTDGLTHDRFNVDLLLKLGIAQAESANLTGAEASFLRAAELRPSAPEPWLDLAELYRRQGRTSDAAAAQAKADSLR